MRITVLAKPRSSSALVEKIDNQRYRISVTEPPEHGKANQAVRRALAAELGIAQSRLSLVMGATARTKVFVVR